MNELKITIKSIYDYLTKLFPLKEQEIWDQSGIRLFCYKTNKVNKVLICLDCNNEVINYAIKNKINLIISHHPIFKKSKYITPNKFDVNDLNLLKKNKITLISLHTCADNNSKGLNYYILNKLNVQNIKRVNTKAGNYFYCQLNEKKYIDDFAHELYDSLKLSHIFFDKSKQNKKINNIALCCGSGFSIFKENLNKLSKYDAILTGDIKWHDWQLANNCSWALIDIGHDVEKWFIDMIKEFLTSKFKNLSIETIYPNFDIYFKTR